MESQGPQGPWEGPGADGNPWPRGLLGTQGHPGTLGSRDQGPGVQGAPLDTILLQPNTLTIDLIVVLVNILCELYSETMSDFHQSRQRLPILSQLAFIIILWIAIVVCW